MGLGSGGHDGCYTESIRLIDLDTIVTTGRCGATTGDADLLGSEVNFVVDVSQVDGDVGVRLFKACSCLK